MGMSNKRSADLGAKLSEIMTDGQTADLGAKLFTCMLSHHLQNMMDKAGITKTDIMGESDPTACLPTLPLYHGGHWRYKSKKGSINLALLYGPDADPKFPYEIYSWQELFWDTERFETQEKAESRIVEVLG